MHKILVIDNYDSFTYNLVQMLLCLGLSPMVFRNDKITLQQIQDLSFDYLLISPGPKDPSASGISIPAIELLHRELPVLGVCLGLQCINEFYKGSTLRAPWPVHGKTCLVQHKNAGLFKGMPNPFSAARYHSLQVRLSPDSPLQITASSQDQVIMGLQHPELPLFGVQFHPESFLTQDGLLIMQNFLQQEKMYHARNYQKNRKDQGSTLL